MARPIRLGLIVPDINDPTSYYRGTGPFSMLQKQLGGLEFIFPNPVSPATIRLCDVLFLQRPASPEHFNALVMAKDEGIPVWCDFDDNNLHVGRDNPAYHIYNQPAVKDSIVKLIRYSDAVSVSTEKLRKSFSIYNKNVFVIPNAFDDFLLRLRAIPSTPRDKQIMWRGTPTHHKNLKVIEHEVIKAATKYPEWKFGFLGHEPLSITEGTFREFQPSDFEGTETPDKVANELLRKWRQSPTQKLKNAVVHNNGMALPLKEYFKAIINIHATAYYYALAQNDHAQSRSHVSWLEATFAGALFIGPDHDEFKRPGVLNFKTPEEFYSIIESVIKGEIDIDKHVEESWNHVQEHYLLSKVNNLRAQVLKQLHEMLYGRPQVTAPEVPA